MVPRRHMRVPDSRHIVNDRQQSKFSLGKCLHGIGKVSGCVRRFIHPGHPSAHDSLHLELFGTQALWVEEQMTSLAQFSPIRHTSCPTASIHLVPFLCDSHHSCSWHHDDAHCVGRQWSMLLGFHQTISQTTPMVPKPRAF